MTKLSAVALYSFAQTSNTSTCEMHQEYDEKRDLGKYKSLLNGGKNPFADSSLVLSRNAASREELVTIRDNLLAGAKELEAQVEKAKAALSTYKAENEAKLTAIAKEIVLRDHYFEDVVDYRTMNYEV